MCDRDQQESPLHETNPAGLGCIRGVGDPSGQRRKVWEVVMGVLSSTCGPVPLIQGMEVRKNGGGIATVTGFVLPLSAPRKTYRQVILHSSIRTGDGFQPFPPTGDLPL